jgi:hypothetical protein
MSTASAEILVMVKVENRSFVARSARVALALTIAALAACDGSSGARKESRDSAVSESAPPSRPYDGAETSAAPDMQAGGSDGRLSDTRAPNERADSSSSTADIPSSPDSSADSRSSDGTSGAGDVPQRIEVGPDDGAADLRNDRAGSPPAGAMSTVSAARPSSSAVGQSTATRIVSIAPASRGGPAPVNVP